MPSVLKETLLKKIEATDDENLLQLLTEDYNYFTGNGDITDGLSKDEIEDLKSLVNEPDGKDCISWDEYKKETAKWRKK